MLFYLCYKLWKEILLPFLKKYVFYIWVKKKMQNKKLTIVIHISKNVVAL